MMNRIALTLLLLLAPSSASAQLPERTTVLPNEPFRLAFDHNGINTAGYRVFVDGVRLGIDLPPSIRNPQTGIGEVAMPGLPRGEHSIVVTVFNLDGEAPSQPLLVYAVLASPDPATNLKVLPARVPTR